MAKGIVEGKFEIINYYETTNSNNEYEYGKIRLSHHDLKQLKSELDDLYRSIKYHHQPAESSVFKQTLTSFLIPDTSIKDIEPYDVLILDEIKDCADGLTKLTGEMKGYVIKSVKKTNAPYGPVTFLELGEQI